MSKTKEDLISIEDAVKLYQDYLLEWAREHGGYPGIIQVLHDVVAIAEVSDNYEPELEVRTVPDFLTRMTTVKAAMDREDDCGVIEAVLNLID